MKMKKKKKKLWDLHCNTAFFDNVQTSFNFYILWEKNSIQICINKVQCSEQNWKKPSAVNLENPGCPAHDLYGKTKIF